MLCLFSSTLIGCCINGFCSHILYPPIACHLYSTWRCARRRSVSAKLQLLQRRKLPVKISIVFSCFGESLFWKIWKADLKTKQLWYGNTMLKARRGGRRLQGPGDSWFDRLNFFLAFVGWLAMWGVALVCVWVVVCVCSAGCWFVCWYVCCRLVCLFCFVGLLCLFVCLFVFFVLFCYVLFCCVLFCLLCLSCLFVVLFVCPFPICVSLG